MKTYLSCALVLLVAATSVAIASPESDALEAKEKAAWQAYKDKKADDFKKLVSPQGISLYSDGVYDLQKEVDGMAKVDMKSFALSDFKVTMPDANTAVVTYKAKIEAKMGGKDESGDYNAASVWIKQNGEWRNVFHTNIEVDNDDDDDDDASPTPTKK